EQHELALREDPLNLTFRLGCAACLMSVGKTDEGRAHLYQALELDQNFPIGYFWLAANCAVRGMYSEALPFAEKAYAIESRAYYIMGLLAGIRSQLGIPHEELLRQLESQPWGLGIYHLVRGEVDVAIDRMEKAIADRSALFPIFLGSLLG